MDQGGITFVKILLEEMFAMVNYVISGLHKYLENFKRGGLSKMRGDKVTNITAQLVDIDERLCEDKYFPRENPYNFLTGLTKCSVPDFKGTFEMAFNSKFLGQI